MTNKAKDIAFHLLMEKLQIHQWTPRWVVQYSVYLAQRLGADQGYRFQWGEVNIYSPELREQHGHWARDFSSASDEQKLHPRHEEACERFLQLYRRPKRLNIGEGEWLQLLAVMDYLQHVCDRDDAAAEKIIKERFVLVTRNDLQAAKRALEKAGLRPRK